MMYHIREETAMRQACHFGCGMFVPTLASALLR